jgi:hypothetical protein
MLTEIFTEMLTKTLTKIRRDNSSLLKTGQELHTSLESVRDGTL